MLNADLPRSHRRVQRRLSNRAELPINQPAGLSKDELSRQKRTRLRLEQTTTRIMVRIATVGRSEQYARVNQQRQRPNPSESICSASAAVRPELDSPAATKPSRRRFGICSARTRDASSSGDTDCRAASCAKAAARSSGRLTLTLIA